MGVYMSSARIPRSAIAVALLGSLLLPTGVKGSVKEDKSCVDCHAASDLSMKVDSGEEISLFIDESVYSGSPHGTLGCRSCHGNFSRETHTAGRRFSSRNEYAAQRNETCKNCHALPMKKEAPMHNRLVMRDGAPRCTSCHVPHKMRPVQSWKDTVGTSIYCLTCHKEKLNISLNGKATLELTILDAAQGKEVEMNHNCTDCHAGYSKQEHPLWNAETRQKQVQDAVEICRKCHAGQYRLVEGSMHYRLRTQGDPGAPGCTDCHGYHAVEAKVDFEWLSGNSCRQCHEDVFTAYAGTGHGQRRALGHLEAPACPDCHRSHDVSLASLEKPFMEACLGCHQNTHNNHRKWLPQVYAHFEALACTACHSPVSSNVLVVTIYDTVLMKNISNADVARRVGVKQSDLNAGDPTKPQDLTYWSELTRVLNRKAATGSAQYLLRLGVASGVKAHELGGRQESRKNCESCHEGGVEYLDRVFGP